MILWWLYVNLLYWGLIANIALHAFDQADIRLVGSPSSHLHGHDWRGVDPNYGRIPYVWVQPRNRMIDMTGHLHGPAMEPETFSF